MNENYGQNQNQNLYCHWPLYNEIGIVTFNQCMSLLINYLNKLISIRIFIEYLYKLILKLYNKYIIKLHNKYIIKLHNKYVLKPQNK